MTDLTDKLASMIDSVINDEPEQAEVDFHDYLKPKLQSSISTDTGGDDTLKD